MITDLKGTGDFTVTLDAGASYGFAGEVSHVWTDAAGNVLANGPRADVALTPGRHEVTLTLTDAAGAVSSDRMWVDVRPQGAVLMSDDFSAGTLSGWTIVDEGEFGGKGPEGTQSEWLLKDGALVQTTDLASRQLTWAGASNSDPWKTGWSPMGDGVNVLRKGTYALWNDEAALAWRDYAVQATVQSPDNGALGLLFHYQDANNYYKLELDANGDYDRAPRNGAGSLFQLIRVKDGVEKFINQFPAKYTPGVAFDLRVEVVAGQIQGFVDGDALFAYPLEDHAITSGTIGLFSWDSAGVGFDDVSVVALDPARVAPDLVLTGDEFDNELTGRGGNDVIAGLGGDDILTGGAGDDRIDGGEGDDLLSGDAGDDVLAGGAGDDLLSGGAGHDSAQFAAAGEYLVDLDRVTVESAAEGIDTLDSIERLVFSQGDDILRFTTGDAVFDIDGGAGTNHLILEGEGQGRLGALHDITTLAVAGGQWTLGVDGQTLTLADGAQALTLGAEALADGAWDGQIRGLGQDDRLMLEGIDAASTVALTTGNVLEITTPTGVVTLSLDPEADYRDFAFSLEAAEGGVELVLVDNGPKDVTGAEGSDVLVGQGGDDRLDGKAGDDVIHCGAGEDEVRGGSGNDQAWGDEGDDMLDGGSGNDQLSGGAGNDHLRGGSGDDRLDGGTGNDLLTGGSGADVFHFAAGFGQDVITDFRPGDDRLSFAEGLFADREAVLAAAIQEGRDVVINLGDDSITLQRVSLNSLTQQDDLLA